MAEWIWPDHGHPAWQVAISDADDGNMSFRYGPAEVVSTARQSVLEHLGLKAKTVLSLSLDVSFGVHWLESRPPNHSILHQQGWPAEGVWIPVGQTDLFLLVGDCFPLAVYEPTYHVMGMFHAGRPELQAGLLERFFELGQEHGIDFTHLRVFIGPGICPKHYVFQTLPPDLQSSFHSYIQPTGQEYQIDLQAYIRDSLRSFGVVSTHITSDGRCTYESPNLFSHRRSRGQGEARFAMLTHVHT